MKKYKDTKYWVTEDGRVWSERSNRFLKLCDTADGYKVVGVGNRKSERVHRLVAMVYIPNPENKPEVNHIDGDKTNNHMSNLEWVTGKENVRHAFKLGLLKPTQGVRQAKSKLTEDQVKEIRLLYIKNMSQCKIASLYGVSQHLISLIVRGELWKHIV